MNQADELELVLVEGLSHGVLLQGRPHDGSPHVWYDLDVADAGTCEHTDAVCGFCLQTWHKDWELRLIDLDTGETWQL